MRPHIEKQVRQGRVPGMLGALAVAVALFCAETRLDADTPVASAAQVKAVFLFNFAKYVDWPESAFSNAAAPITIGVVGIDPFGDNLQHIVDGKTINGRPIAVKHLAADDNLAGCHILFISHSEASRMSGILDKTSALPILTVGEDEQFSHNNGIIDFIIKDGKVRLEINLAAARQAGLTISSKLLAVADVVKGKSN